MTAAERTAEIQRTKERIAAVEAAIDECVKSGAQSASLSSAGNSQSYTRLSLAELRAELARLSRKLRVLTTGSPIRRFRQYPNFC